ncbi:MAG: mechanosensitive ion channel family protein, partial [Acidobacteriota bacterium]|nr:mechanosensitive ion channel family protein [Acidobacteriota bacterium]
TSIQWGSMTGFEHSHAKARLRRDWFGGAAAGLIAFAAIGVGRTMGKVSNSAPHQKVIAWGCAFILLLAGGFAIRRLAHALGHVVTLQYSPGTGASLRLLISGVGYVVLVFALFGVLGVSLQHLLIGAGLAGVVLGIAAQQSLGNIFASVVLLFARPFVVGDTIRVRSGVVGNVDALVLGIGLTYVTVRTTEGVLKIPNSIMLASGIGRPLPPESN